MAAGSSTQITTTVLWRNDVHGRDVTGIRVTPDRVVVSLQQLIPLPEVAEYTVGRVVRRSESLPVEGRLTGDELAAASVSHHPKAEEKLRRCLLDEPFPGGGRTWGAVDHVGDRHRRGDGRAHQPGTGLGIEVLADAGEAEG